MVFLTRWFGVTETDAERNVAVEKSDIEEITEKILAMQSQAATKQHRPIGRGTHVKGVCARAEFEVFGTAAGRDPGLAARLAKGIFAKPGVYPAVVRFANADANINSDFKPDVRALSFSVDLTSDGVAAPRRNVGRQDFSMQNATTLPINDARAFLATMKLLAASNKAACLWSLFAQGQVEGPEDALVCATAVTPENPALSATALLEYRALSSWTERCGEAFGYAVTRQSGASSAEE